MARIIPLDEKIRNLLNAANDATEAEDTNLTDAVKRLIEGYGTGGVAALRVKYPARFECKVSKNGKEIVAPDKSGIALFVLPEIGKWDIAISGTLNGEEAVNTESVEIVSNEIRQYDIVYRKYLSLDKTVFRLVKGRSDATVAFPSDTAEYIRVKSSSNSPSTACAVTAERINVTGYDKLKARMNVVKVGSTSMGAYLGVAINTADAPSEGSDFVIDSTISTSNNYYDYSRINSTGEITAEFDISAYNAERYIMTSTSGASSESHIYSIWLEKE